MDEPKGLLGNAITLIIGLMLLITLLGLIFNTPILKAFGASDAIMPYAVDYMTVILFGTVFQGIGTGLLNVVRATGHPVKSIDKAKKAAFLGLSRQVLLLIPLLLILPFFFSFIFSL